ncbi:MAG: HAMP domain-containing histidine kinase [Bacteroidales bacterium]|nr:HAMP domain-containing histidine kinase [Bacteroidales bacterium]
MDWSDWAVWVALAAIVVVLLLYIRLMLKNVRLRQLADEANRLRREAEATEQRNRQLKQEMTSNIAHELKTPVSSIRGYLEILLGDRPVDEDRRRYYLERSYSQTLRLSDLIHDVSMINKLEESSDLFPRTTIDVCAVANEALDELSDKADAAGIILNNNLPTMPIQGNHELLYCIFRNLLENSISYAGEGVSTVIETYKESPEYYYIHFYDTGKGVADEYLSRLFDRFVRIDSGRSRQNGGTGLGLSIVKHAVLFHGGEIYAKNRSEGGLEFFFSLKKH